MVNTVNFKYSYEKEMDSAPFFDNDYYGEMLLFDWTYYCVSMYELILIKHTINNTPNKIHI